MTESAPREVAVIGAGGFIGQAVTRHLMDSGHRVHPVLRDTNPDDWPAGVDVAVFAAGNSSTRVSLADPVRCLEDNVAALDRYLLGLRARRFVFLSSLSVYPVGRARKGEDDVIALDSIPLYGAHKLLAERHVAEFAREWVCLRLGSLFGPGLKKNLFHDLKIGGRDVWLTRDSKMAPLDVRDAARAVADIALSDGLGVINLASRHVVTVDEVLALKPGDYRFHEERHIDESGVALDRQGRVWQENLDREAHFSSIRRFIAGAGE